MDNTILQSVIGLTIVILGSQLAIFSATSITKSFKLSTGIISILFLGAGTSLPELASTISLAVQKKPTLITPNIIGSNVCNILLCLGFAALFAEIKAESSENRYSSVVAAIVAVISALLLYFEQFNKIIAVISCTIFIAYLWSIRPKNQKAAEQKQINLLEPIHNKTKANLITNIFLLLVSLLGLSYGSEIFVRSISIFASLHNLTDTATGIVFIATGTSLPELAISIIAAIKKEYDIVYGNILGSNIFNTLTILSVGTLISKEPIPQPNLLLLVMSVIVAIATMIVVLKTKAISRAVGILMIIAYFALSAYYL